ncbi:putative ATP-binding protein involved in virulence [Tenacibaculum litoreum]|uniref:AAA family ATPase n=1 Tax=Tenacibaculum litoreum TaxID=321269 RepID=UPI0038954972
MKLNSLYIKDYKLLNDFEVDFSPSKSIAAFIGKNGSGKTTLVECLSIIFAKLFECTSLKGIYELKYPFRFKIQYLLKSEKITNTTAWGESFVNYYAIELEYDGKIQISLFESSNTYSKQSEIEKYLRNIGESFEYILPASLMVYYSGISDILYNLYQSYQSKNILGSLDGEIKIDQPFYYFTTNNFPLILIALLSYQYGDVPDKLLSKNKIQGFKKIVLDFDKPKWAKPKATAKDFWGAKGDLKIFLTRLAATVDEVVIKSPTQISYVITNQNSLIRLWEYYGTEKRLFEYLVALQANGLLTNVEIFLNKGNIQVPFQRLSEGEKQQLIIMGLKELLAAENSLFLLDEPDTYLHPEWKREFIYELIKNENAYQNFYLITSHSPDIVSAMRKDQLFIMASSENNARLKVFAYNPYGKEVDDILLEVFDVDDLRYKEVEMTISLLWQMIKDKKHNSVDFERLFNDLQDQIGKDDEAITQLKVELAKRKNG